MFKVKDIGDGETEMYKSRLIAKGYNQNEDLNYQETLTCSEDCRCQIDFLAAYNQWCLHQMDIFNAFLEGDLIEEVYMTPCISGLYQLGEHDQKVYDCTNPSIGLKQASR